MVFYFEYIRSTNSELFAVTGGSAEYQIYWLVENQSFQHVARQSLQLEEASKPSPALAASHSLCHTSSLRLAARMSYVASS
jgi:hypothetical protein